MECQRFLVYTEIDGQFGRWWRRIASNPFYLLIVRRAGHERGVGLRPIAPGKPNQNDNTSNRRLRDECLNEHWLQNLPLVRTLIEP